MICLLASCPSPNHCNYCGKNAELLENIRIRIKRYGWNHAIDPTDIIGKEAPQKMIWRKARKKPIVIEFREPLSDKEIIHTREGSLIGIKGFDFIIRGVEGELYPISKEIFAKTYEILDEEAS